MRVVVTLSALAAAFELAQATIYFAGDSTMAKNGANDGVTDGTSSQDITDSSLLTPN
jgi:rhamnogalacturonan acetylesterase